MNELVMFQLIHVEYVQVTISIIGMQEAVLSV